MRVTLEAPLFDSNRVDPLDLLALLQLGYEGRHLMATDPLDDHRVESWLAARGRLEAEACSLALENGLLEQTRAPRTPISVRVTSSSVPPRFAPGELVLSLADALVLLRSEFRVLVENNHSDRDFLLAIMPAEWKAKILDMESKGWLRFELGGGVTQMTETVRNMAGNHLERVSTWVMFDSDALAPHRPGPNIPALVNLCTRLVPFHCLERRAIENYIPLMALNHWADLPARDREVKLAKARALPQASRSQRAHYNMKYGFNGDANRADLNNVGTLFDGLPAASRQTLATGFGPQIADLFAWHNSPNWDWWMTADREGGEAQRITEALFSRL